MAPPAGRAIGYALERVAGVVVEHQGKLFFVPASVAQQIVARPTVSRVLGTDIGIALVGGRVTSVIEVDHPTSVLLLCDVDGERVAFSGMNVVGCGFYPRRGAGIALGDELVPELDLITLLQRRAMRIDEPG